MRSFKRANIRLFSDGPKGNDNMKKIADGISNISNHFNQASKSKRFSSYVLSHPFKAYFKVGSVIFGGVFVANTFSGLMVEDPPISPYEAPQSFAWMNLSKSMYFGLVWPSVPFMLLDSEQRKDLCILGRGIKRATDDLQKAADEISDDITIKKNKKGWTWNIEWDRKKTRD